MMKNANTQKLLNFKTTALLSLLAAGSLLSAASAAELTVTIAPVEKAAGEIMLAIYDSESNFRKTETIAISKAAVTGEMQFSFPDLTAGHYAIMVFHDVNGNGKLDTNLMGMPKEPWGGSLQGKSVFGAPGWADTKFDLPGDGFSIAIKLN